MEQSSACLMANPTPCSLFTSGLLPCQSNVYLSSLMHPEDRSLVPCKATISILSLSSSLSITAVLWVPSINCRPSSSLVVSVLTFHVPSLRVRSVLCLFSFFLPGALSDLLLGFCPSSTHPMEQWMVMEQNLTDWGLPSLRHAISVQIRLCGL